MFDIIVEDRLTFGVFLDYFRNYFRARRSSLYHLILRQRCSEGLFINLLYITFCSHFPCLKNRQWFIPKIRAGRMKYNTGIFKLRKKACVNLKFINPELQTQILTYNSYCYLKYRKYIFCLLKQFVYNSTAA